jgi:hypothetical protein
MRKSAVIDRTSRRASSGAAPQGEAASQWRPTHEQISFRAYEIYLAKGAQDGRDRDDWFEAERLLIAEQPKPAV